MEEKLVEARLASLILLLEYQKIFELSFGNMTDNAVYKGCINKLIDYFQTEKEIYDSLDKDFVIDCYKHANAKACNTHVDMRLLAKITERAVKYLEEFGTVDDVLISSLISSKKYVDAAKDVKNRIVSLYGNKKINTRDLFDLQITAKSFMFVSFMDNSFLEKMALDYDFILENIPRIDLTKYILLNGNSFVEQIQPLLCVHIITSIEDLTKVTSYNDKIKTMFSSLNDFAYINSLLPYLDEEHLNGLWDEFVNNSNKLDRNAALRKVRKLIEKRKEEFMK